MTISVYTPWRDAGGHRWTVDTLCRACGMPGTAHIFMGPEAASGGPPEWWKCPEFRYN